MSKQYITLQEMQDDLQNLEESAKTKYGMDACAPVIERLAGWIHRGGGEWTDAKINPKYNAETMKILGGSDEHGGAPVPHPSTTATAPTAEEQEVINHYQKLHNRDVVMRVATAMKGWAEILLDYLRKLKNLQREEADSRDLNYYGAHLDDALVNMEITRDDEKLDALRGPQKEFREALNNFNNFRKAHGIEDENRRVKYSEGWPFYIGIVVIGIAESYFNGFFYAQVTDGFIEAVLVAIVVSFCVVSSSALAGKAAIHLRGLTRINDLKTKGVWEKHSWGHKFYWGFWTVLCLLVATLGVFVAYLYRDAAGFLLYSGALDNLESYGGAIIDYVLTRVAKGELWPQAGLTSLGLVVVNAGIGGWIFYKMHFTRTDCLPGYMNYATTLKQARENYKREIASQEEKSGLKEERLSKFIAELKKAAPTRAGIEEMKKVVKKIANMAQFMQDAAKIEAKRYTDRCRTILEGYRHANRQARPENDKNGPAYFNEYPEFEPQRMEDFLKEYEELRKKIERIDDVDSSHVERLLSVHRNKVAEILKEKLKEGRRNRIDQYRIVSKVQADVELTEKEKKKKDKQIQRQERAEKRKNQRRQKSKDSTE